MDFKFEFEKGKLTEAEKRLCRRLCESWELDFLLGEIYLTWPRVKCLRGTSSSPDVKGVWHRITQSLHRPHSRISYPAALCHAGGQMGTSCPHNTKMLWWSDSRQTQKWNKSIVASLTKKTKPQHNMIMTANPLKHWSYPQGGTCLKKNVHMYDWLIAC